MICVCSIIIVISASYYNAVKLHGFVKIFKFRGTLKCTLRLALDGALCGATERGYRCENIIDFVNDNLESCNKSFCSVIMCSDPLFHASVQKFNTSCVLQLINNIA